MSSIDSVFFYIIVLLISTMFFSLYKSHGKILRRIGVSISIILPSILAGFRYEVGTDYRNYNAIFSALRNTKWREIFSRMQNMEKGFLVFSKACTLLFSNKMIFGIIAFLIVSIFVYTLLSQYRDYDLTVCYLLFLFSSFLSSFNGMRQYIAVLILFYGMRFVFENKPIRFLLIVGFAALFHLTVILALPIWFLWNHKENRCISIKANAPLLVMVAIVILSWKTILRFLLNVNIPFISKYQGYLSGNESNNRSFYLQVAIALAVIALIKYIKQYDNKIKFFVYVYIIGALIGYTGFYITYAKRIGIYYTFPEPLILCMIPYAFKGKNKQIVKALACVYGIAYFIIISFILGQADIIPYRWN